MRTYSREGPFGGRLQRSAQSARAEERVYAASMEVRQAFQGLCLAKPQKEFIKFIGEISLGRLSLFGAFRRI